MDKESLKRRLKKDAPELIKKHLIKKFESVSKQIQDIILQRFDNELSSVADRNSRMNPSFYREDFERRLENFPYIEESGDTISLIVPDMENFNFSGRLQAIKTIMEGVMGTYVELDADQYQQVFNKKPINEEPLDEYLSPKEQIYLVKYLPNVRRAERDLNTKFAKYPFSNKPPIDIMRAAEDFVNSNIARWIDEALEEANKELVRAYKGVK